MDVVMKLLDLVWMKGKKGSYWSGLMHKDQ